MIVAVFAIVRRRPGLIAASAKSFLACWCISITLATHASSTACDARPGATPGSGFSTSVPKHELILDDVADLAPVGGPVEILTGRQVWDVSHRRYL